MNIFAKLGITLGFIFFVLLLILLGITPTLYNTFFYFIFFNIIMWGWFIIGVTALISTLVYMIKVIWKD